MHEQIKNGLASANADELECARAACDLLSRLLDNPENWGRGTPLPWRAVKLASLLWRSPDVRAATVGLIVLGMRKSKPALGEEAVALFASIAGVTSALQAEPS
jgi:hypothetical protein